MNLCHLVDQNLNLCPDVSVICVLCIVNLLLHIDRCCTGLLRLNETFLHGRRKYCGYVYSVARSCGGQY